ncbi:nitrate reductase cytochrome c-type subunit [Ferrovibrio sp.]|uniref:nitrate reductase cytochrome c-type subunit n=1 Tax=Ferrovibrio sp. TaxID=1917215 RepID=UPI001B76A595|nr:nitrate reductase cytochrome c-type subunit [Ferrovibrio sp.]MBP7065038.1 nitrate reductase cytochrome c-type subunit [Ferrovibrio sp.]
MTKLRLLICILLLLGGAVSVQAADVVGLRGPTPIAESTEPLPIAREVNDDRRRSRNYPEQPPVIPHSIQGYEVSLNANRCLSCHSRQMTEMSQAPMISVTHFMDRDDQILASVSARRYFCTQCHVSQHDAKPLVQNGFVDIDTLINRQREAQGSAGTGRRQ